MKNGIAKRRRRNPLALLVIGSFLIVLLGGCSSSDRPGNDPSGECLAAFRNADPRALPPYGASPLDDAIRACATVADWRAAWDRVPDAHPGAGDPLAILTERCRDASLAATRICAELAGQPS